jgi:hypothetical protein
MNSTDAEMLDSLSRATFEYFRKKVDPDTGLVADKTQPGSPASIAAVGMGLSAYIVAAERGWLSRADAAARTLTALRFFHASHQGPEANATGYKGFYYHFLHMRTGRRAWHCELPTIDTAILMAGVLTAASYFIAKGKEEIGELADSLYRRVDWQWALNGGTTISHGWSPESGFLPYRWDTDYSEALILYILALGSPTFSSTQAATANGPPRFNGSRYTASNIYMPVPCLSIRCLTCGLISGASSTTSTGSVVLTILRTAGGRPTSSSNMELPIHWNSPTITNMDGD